MLTKKVTKITIASFIIPTDLHEGSNDENIFFLNFHS